MESFSLSYYSRRRGVGTYWGTRKYSKLGRSSRGVQSSSSSSGGSSSSNNSNIIRNGGRGRRASRFWKLRSSVRIRWFRVPLATRLVTRVLGGIMDVVSRSSTLQLSKTKTVSEISCPQLPRFERRLILEICKSVMTNRPGKDRLSID